MIKKLLNKIFGNHSNTMSFREGLDLTGLPIVTFSQGEKKLNFILDTGSDVSVIDSNVLSQIEYTTVKDTEGVMYGVDGKRTKTDVCTIPLSYKDVTYTNTFLSRDMKLPFGNLKNDHGVNVHGLLGSIFFNKYRYVLDFESLIAYSKK